MFRGLGFRDLGFQGLGFVLRVNSNNLSRGQGPKPQKSKKVDPLGSLERGSFKGSIAIYGL